jgi:hypothetical protein
LREPITSSSPAKASISSLPLTVMPWPSSITMLALLFQTPLLEPLQPSGVSLVAAMPRFSASSHRC